MDDLKLLKEYATRNSQEAFATLVQRHIGMVYSAALPQLRDPHLAEEITQVVFIILAKKSGELRENTILSGWLYRTTRFACADALKKSQRRQRREQEAYMQSTVENPGGDSTWQEIEPHLDDALTQLGETDRNALVLRFFENRNLREVGVSLGVSEVAAQKRIARAMEKLRALLLKRETVLPVSVLIGSLSANAAQAAPAGLAATVATTAAVKGVAAGASTLTLIKGTLEIMAWTKLKTVAVVSAAVILGSGTAGLVVKEFLPPAIMETDESFWISWDLNKAPPILLIRPTKFWNKTGGYTDEDERLLGVNLDMRTLISLAYNFDENRTVLSPEFASQSTKEHFDVLVNLPTGGNAAFRAELEKRFRFKVRRESNDMNVLLLKIKNSNATGLKISQQEYGGSSAGPGEFSMIRQPIINLASYLEQVLDKPVIDQTGLTNHYDIELKWANGDTPAQIEPLKNVLAEQLGLELAPSVEPIEMLIVERTRN